MTFSWEPIENNLLTIILGLVWSVSLWEFYLNHRQVRYALFSIIDFLIKQGDKKTIKIENFIIDHFVLQILIIEYIFFPFRGK